MQNAERGMMNDEREMRNTRHYKAVGKCVGRAFDAVDEAN
jgi:hypothetical protein